MGGLFAAIVILLLMTPFVKLYTVLTLFRHGLGLSSWGFEIIIVTLAALFSTMIVEPQIVASGGFQQIIQSSDAQRQLSEKLQPFVKQHTDPKIAEKLSATENDNGIRKNGAFLLSQLKDAFLIGLIIMLPFLVTDLLVTNILMALGITQIKAAVVSLPIKILLFIIVDGWGLLGHKLIQGYGAQ